MRHWLEWLILLSTLGSIQAGELAAQYERFEAVTGKQIASPPRDTARGVEGISEIAIERGPCFGPCPTYVYSVNSNGVAMYQGEANVEPIGRRTGRVPILSYARLAQFIRDSHYLTLPNSYSSSVTCGSAVYTRVTIGGRSKIIRNYRDAGPSTLWAVERLLDSLMQETVWDDIERAE